MVFTFDFNNHFITKVLQVFATDILSAVEPKFVLMFCFAHRFF